MFAKIGRSLRLIPFELELVFIQVDSLLPCYTRSPFSVRLSASGYRSVRLRHGGGTRDDTPPRDCRPLGAVSSVTRSLIRVHALALLIQGRSRMR